MFLIAAIPGVVAAEIDPRGDWNLAWTAPGPTGEVAAYDLRLSVTAPGSNLEAWWSAAESQIYLPVPASAGITQTWFRRQLTPGQTVYAAMRARNAAYEWSPISNVTSWTPSAAPLLQSVSPSLTSGGSQAFVVRGPGVASATAVRFHRPGGQIVSGTGIGATLDGSLTFSATLPTGVEESLDLEIVTPGGSDVLRGWIRIGEGSEDPAPATIQTLLAIGLSSSTARLSWNAPLDDGPQGSGAAAQYELRRLGGTPDAWSWETGTVIPTPNPGTPGTSESVTVVGLPAGSLQAFAIRSADAAGNWSAISATAVVDLPDPYVPPVDDLVPNPVTNLSGTAISAESLMLTWTAPADNTPWGLQPISRYELRQLSGSPGNWSWSEGTPLVAPSPRTPGKVETFVVRSLEPESMVAFAVAGVDSAGNMAEPSNFLQVQLPEVVIDPDTTPPVTVDDLAGTVLDPQSVQLTWTAPLDEGPAGSRAVTAYDLRRLAGQPGSWSWDGAMPVETGVPLTPGTAESLTVSGLQPGAWVAFALASMDSSGHWSSLSDFVELLLPVPPDTVGPHAVEDLVAELLDDDLVSLRWTSPVDHDGGIAGLEFREAPTSAEAFDWETAQPMAGVPDAVDPGTIQTWAGALTVSPGDVATVAMRSIDTSGNASPVSNLVTVDRLDEDAVPPAAPLEFEAVRNGPNSVQLRWRAVGDDVLSGRANRYELCVVPHPNLATEWWRSVEPVVLAMDPKDSGKREVCNQRGLDGGVVYGFALRAVDDAGWGSDWIWVLLEVDGGSGPDTAPPLPVEGTHAVSTAHGVEITWSPAPEADVLAYRVHRKEPGKDREWIAEVSSAFLSYVDPGHPVAGTAYAVTSVDAEGHEPDYWQWVGVDALPGSPNVSLSRRGGGWLLSVFPEAPPEVGQEAPRMMLFDVSGRLIAEFDSVPDSEGWTAQWDGRDRSGRDLASGVLFLRIRTAQRVHTQKLLMSR